MCSVKILCCVAGAGEASCVRTLAGPADSLSGVLGTTVGDTDYRVRDYSVEY